MLLAWPRIPEGKSCFINGWVGKMGEGVGGGKMSADYAFLSVYFIASEKRVSVKTLLCVFCQSKSLNIPLPAHCRHLFYDEFCEK